MTDGDAKLAANARFERLSRLLDEALDLPADARAAHSCASPPTTTRSSWRRASRRSPMSPNPRRTFVGRWRRRSQGRA